MNYASNRVHETRERIHNHLSESPAFGNLYSIMTEAIEFLIQIGHPNITMNYILDRLLQNRYICSDRMFEHNKNLLCRVRGSIAASLNDAINNTLINGDPILIVRANELIAGIRYYARSGNICHVGAPEESNSLDPFTGGAPPIERDPTEPSKPIIPLIPRPEDIEEPEPEKPHNIVILPLPPPSPRSRGGNKKTGKQKKTGKRRKTGKKQKSRKH
jgi:hypothetical protein